MNGIAWITYPKGGTILRARGIGEFEALLRHVGASAKLHGHVRVQLNGHSWSVIAADGDVDATCQFCNRRLTSFDPLDALGTLVSAPCARTPATPLGSKEATLKGPNLGK
jgi:hypothetical protein